MARILVADDEHAICEAFRRLLELDGHTPLVASNGHEALTLVRRQRPAAVFLDVQMPDMSGIEALERIHRQQPHLPVIVMTAHGSVETAMKAVELGAFDYLGKPLELDDIRSLLARALRKSNPGVSLPAAADDGEDPAEMIGTSRPMQELFKMLSLLTDNDLTVLVTGEPGVGKGLVARALHRHGQRRRHPFVSVSCAAIPGNRLEGELFGYAPDASSAGERPRIGRLEAAGKGTLVLDEVAELPVYLQARLLRVLEDKSFERIGGGEPVPLLARIVATTVDAPGRQGGDTGSGPLRDDFFHRLSPVNLHIPALRERADDVPLLAGRFLDRANRELGRHVRGIDADAMRMLRRHSWPGNVRELENAIRRAALVARGVAITASDLQLDEAAPPAPSVGDGRQALDLAARRMLAELIDGASPPAHPFRSVVDIVEHALIDEALARSDGNQVAASALLGINRTTLRNKQSG